MATPSTRETLKQYCLRNLGKPVIDINVEKKTAAITVTDNSRNNFAVSPSRKTIGIKILIRTMDVDKI